MNELCYNVIISLSVLNYVNDKTIMITMVNYYVKYKIYFILFHSVTEYAMSFGRESGAKIFLITGAEVDPWNGGHSVSCAS